MKIFETVFWSGYGDNITSSNRGKDTEAPEVAAQVSQLLESYVFPSSYCQGFQIKNNIQFSTQSLGQL